MFSQDPERMVAKEQRAQPPRKSRARSRGRKGDSRNDAARVSRPMSFNTMARTKALLSAALRAWELKRRLSSD